MKSKVWVWVATNESVRNNCVVHDCVVHLNTQSSEGSKPLNIQTVDKQGKCVPLFAVIYSERIAWQITRCPTANGYDDDRAKLGGASTKTTTQN